MKSLPEKLPPPTPILDNTLLFGLIGYWSSSYFNEDDQYDESMIWTAAKRTEHVDHLISVKKSFHTS